MRHIYILVLAILFLNSCTAKVTSKPEKVFQSPEMAYGELVQAAKSGNKQEILELFGEENEELINSGDEVADQASIQQFAMNAQEKHSWESGKESLTLIVGDEEWPFPVPLVKQNNGWIFHTEQGLQEILDRNIGRNELGVLRVCDGYVDAQYDYAEKDRTGDGVREYAQKVASDPGTKNGLYWENSTDRSPIGPGIAKAVREGYRRNNTGKPNPYHGYYYKILTQQGRDAEGGAMCYINGDGNMTEGFALIAYPSRWGVSGVMTFIVNNDGEIFEKDLGENTSEIAEAINSFNPDPGWYPTDNGDGTIYSQIK